MKLFRLLVLSLFVFLPLSLHAQVGLYGSFTVQNMGIPNSPGIVFYGGTFGAYLAGKQFAFLNVGADLRGSFARDAGSSFDTGSIGPRVALNMHVVPIQPYVEGTVGVGHLNFGVGSSINGPTFEYQVLGGVDWAVLPRVNWRIWELSYSGLSVNDSLHPRSLSTGIVFTLPRLFVIGH